MDGWGGPQGDWQGGYGAQDQSGAWQDSSLSPGNSGGAWQGGYAASPPGMSMSGGSLMSGRWSWTPSRRQIGKYASLFQRADYNRDSYIDSNEIKELLDRSRLDQQVLAVAWELSDMDRDGYLSFPEFVTFIHLVSCVKRGAPLPSLQQGLPPELGTSVQALYSENPAQLAAARSRSPSPLPSGLCTPAARSGAASPRHSAFDQGGGCGGWDMPAESNQQMPGFDAPADFATSSGNFGLDALGGTGDGFGSSWEDGGLTTSPKGKKKKDKSGRKSGLDLDFGTTQDDQWADPSTLSPSHWRGADGGGSPSRRAAPGGFDFSGGEDYAMPSAYPEQRFPSFPSAAGSGLGAQPPASSDDRRHRDLNELTQHFEALLEADKSYTRYLRQEMDSKEAAAQRTHQDRAHLEGDARAEQQAIQQMLEKRRQLEAQVENGKQRLADLREERRAVDMEAISLRKDREHFAEELAFLQRLLQEEEQHLEIVNSVNLNLERSYQALETHTQQLEGQRKELLTHMSQEHEATKREEKENAVLRHKLERMHRQLSAAKTGKHHLTRKEEQLRQLQGGQAPAPETNWRDAMNGHPAQRRGIPAGGPAVAKYRSRECV
mmetsp:Transcript_38069/g.89110  ORF Transcript_38069/g.89110 Transcript_38069/m.89110 type:complete len:605 (-) Transcript_38069:47-1861(-)